MSTRARRSLANLTRQSGLSLVELMVSVVIGLLLVFGATTIYVNSRKTADIDETHARLHETARYALSVIETDTRMTNYWGLIKDASEIVNKLSQLNASVAAASLVTSTDAVKCGSTFAVDVERFIQAHNNNYSLPCAAHTGAVASADTLTIRRASTTATTADNKRVQICTSRNYGEIIRAASCSADEVRDLLVNTYYIDRQSVGNDTYPSLRRKSLVSGPEFNDEEVIPGIEDMQIQLGWDASGVTGTVTRYVDPDDPVLATGQIVAVRIWLLVRAETPDRSFTDTRTYAYADRDPSSTTSDITLAAAAKKAYKPNDNFRRLLVSRTFFLRNAVGT